MAHRIAHRHETGLRIGSLCSGIGGLDLGVQAALGGDIAWHAETDPRAVQILARHRPKVPNHGDITTIDWTTTEPVCVLTAGFPCQDLSVAGPRTGLVPGTRSGLWHTVTRAIPHPQPLPGGDRECPRPALHPSRNPHRSRRGTLPAVYGRPTRSTRHAGTGPATRRPGRPRVRRGVVLRTRLRHRRPAPSGESIPRLLARNAPARKGC